MIGIENSSKSNEPESKNPASKSEELTDLIKVAKGIDEAVHPVSSEDSVEEIKEKSLEIGLKAQAEIDEIFSKSSEKATDAPVPFGVKLRENVVSLKNDPDKKGSFASRTGDTISGSGTVNLWPPDTSISSPDHD